MAGRLSKRVARLERGRSRACPVCGGGGRGPVAYEVVVPEAAERVPPGGAARPPEPCPKCRRPRAFWIAMAPPRKAEDD